MDKVTSTLSRASVCRPAWQPAKARGEASYFRAPSLCLGEEGAAALCGASPLLALASAAPASAPFRGVLAAVLWLEVPVATYEKRKT